VSPRSVRPQAGSNGPQASGASAGGPSSARGSRGPASSPQTASAKGPRGNVRRVDDSPSAPAVQPGERPEDPCPAPRRGRRALRALELVAGVALVLGASVGVAWGARRYVTTSPRFAVRTIQVEGASHRTPDHVVELSGIEPGHNVFALDYERAKSALLRDPWIETATVTRALPGTVTIRVVEREARVLSEIGGDLYLTSRAGEPFKKIEASDPTDLPVVTGVSSDDVARNRQGAARTLRRAIEALDELEGAGIDKRWPVQELRTERDGALTATIGKEGIVLQLGQPPHRPKIEAAKAVLAEVQRRQAKASVVFLDNEAHPERVVVRMR
jgi:cell division protein FtsQ